MSRNKRIKRDQQTDQDEDESLRRANVKQTYQDESLWRAIVECEDPDTIILPLIETSSDSIIQRTYKNGDYLLHVACRHRPLDTVIMKLLELFPIAASYKNDDNWYPLHVACTCSSDMSEQVLIKLLELYPEVASIKYEKHGRYFICGGYILHEACRKVRSVAFIRQLIEAYPRALEETNIIRYYPIHCALERIKSTSIIQLLIDADPLAIQRIKCDPKLGNSSLHIASRSYSFIMATGKYTCIPSLEYMVEHCNDAVINKRNSEGRTPLHEACILGLADTFETLLQHPGILINAIDYRSETPLHKLFHRVDYPSATLKQVLAATRILLNHPYIIIDHTNYSNKTPLDLLKEQIDEFKHLDNIDVHSSDRRRQGEKDYLSQCKASLILLEEFVVQQRWHSYQYFFTNA